MERSAEDILGQEDEHPSYALVSFSHATSGGGMVLVDSAIKHSSTIKLRISRALRRRMFNTFDYYARKELIEVEMSPVQFAEAITNMNTQGVPCTLRHVDGEQMPNPVFDCERTRVIQEFSDDTKEVAKRLDDLAAFANSLLEKPSVTKQDRKDLLEKIRMARQDIASDLPFVVEQFNETVEKTLSRAKGEFEAYVLHRALHLGNSAMVEQQIEGEVQLPQLALEDDNLSNPVQED